MNVHVYYIIWKHVVSTINKCWIINGKQTLFKMNSKSMLLMLNNQYNPRAMLACCIDYWTCVTYLFCSYWTGSFPILLVLTRKIQHPVGIFVTSYAMATNSNIPLWMYGFTIAVIDLTDSPTTSEGLVDSQLSSVPSSGSSSPAKSTTTSTNTTTDEGPPAQKFTSSEGNGPQALKPSSIECGGPQALMASSAEDSGSPAQGGPPAPRFLKAKASPTSYKQRLSRRRK